MTATPTEVARATGIPRTTVYDLMRRIGGAFERAGISATSRHFAGRSGR
jgi:hypothetical protein